MRDTSLKVPPGVEGTVINARVFSRKGVSKDERSRLIEEEEVAKLKKDQQDEQRIIRESTLKKVRKLLVGETTATRVTDDARKVMLPKGHEITAEDLEEIPQTLWAEIKIGNEKVEEELGRVVEAMQEQLSLIRMVFQEKIERLKGGRRAAAGRHQDGQGVRRHQAQAAGRRQDGRPARQQGRALAHLAGRGHAVPGRRHAGRHRAQSRSACRRG